jgi:filamin
LNFVLFGANFIFLDLLEFSSGDLILSLFSYKDSTHLVDGKPKLILGLLWTLILHYSISMPMWEGEDQDPNKRGKNPTPKQKLMDWIQSRMPPELPITNFTTDWNDGRAIGALVDSCAPGMNSILIPE